MQNRDPEYQSCINNSERVSWRIDDLLPKDAAIDFTRRILSDALTGTESLGCLSAEEKLLLNQIRSNSYAHLFLFLEEYVVELMSQRAGFVVHRNSTQMRALLRFSEEEIKHQQLFSRYTALFARGFKVTPALLNNQVEVARIILSKSHLAVLILNLHLELITQQHYLESIRDNQREDLDPLLCNMLKYHWFEEAQHARLDYLEAQKVLAEAPEAAAALDSAMTEYAELLAGLRGVLVAQLELDIQTLEKAAGRAFTEDERKEIFTAQERSYVWTFIGVGMKAPLFLSRVRELSTAAEQRIIELAPTYYCN